MLYESAGVRVEADDGVATLWLDFAGAPVNALSLARLTEIDRGATAAVYVPGVEILIVRSANPAGFCGGSDFDAFLFLSTDADRAEYARAGQEILTRLTAVPFPTIAFVHGPCLGPGLELALACDYRLAVSGPESAIGFPEHAHGLVPCWGGVTRLTRLIGRTTARDFLASGQSVSGREAARLGLFDDAFSARRAKIELRTVLDHVQRTGTLPPRRRWLRRRGHPAGATRSVYLDGLTRAADRTVAEGEARERAWFVAAAGTEAVRLRTALLVRPQSPASAVAEFGVVGDWSEASAELVGRAALRGVRVLVPASNRGVISQLDAYLATKVRRGFVTPLEADDARRRVEPTPSVEEAPLVLQVAGDDATVTLPGGGEFPLGLPLPGQSSRLVEVGNGPLATAAALNRVTRWLSRLGYDPVVVADVPGLVVRRILFAVFDEAVRLAAEGVPIDRIDEAGDVMLPPDGPLTSIDRLGISRVANGVRRLVPLAAIGLAFYRPGRYGRRVPNPEAGALLWESRFQAAVAEPECNVVRPAGDLPPGNQALEIADRLEHRAINEAARCLHADPFAAAVEIDLLAAEGAGVFEQAGGPLAVVDARGLVTCIRSLSHLAGRYGPRFAPCPGLVRRAAAGECFRTAAPLPTLRPTRRRVA
jgi:3-hydroxyacyl-CoA dehydrogenase/enoyl-CoA hydratase/3-hydroxybutyryl-CoA epimerase